MQKIYYRKQRYCTGSTNKALRNTTGSSRGGAKRGRGRGVNTRGTHFGRYLHGSVNYGN